MKNYGSLANRLLFLLFSAGAAFAEPPPAETAPSPVPAPQTETAPPVEAPSFQTLVNQILPQDGQRFGKLGAEMTLYYKPLILRLYKENGQQPLWNPAAIQSLADALKGLSEEGLNPDEYRFGAIASYLDAPSQTPPSPAEQAKADILLTEACLRALDNLQYGKVDPDSLDADSNYAPARNGQDRAPQLLSWIKQGRIDEAFNGARPQHDRYKWLKAALSQYRQIREAGGWSPVPAGKTLKPGGSDSRIPLIRRRLVITGDLPPPVQETAATDAAPAAESIRFDEELVQGVKKFQQRHNLEANAVIGPATLAAMNVPVEQRIDQLRLNMERQRWYFAKDLDEHLIVDVAGFAIFWMKGQEVQWQERVQVGQRMTKTPIFRDQIEHVIFNPTWSVPPGINRRTILPSLKLDASYLDKKGYELLDEKGKPIDPYSIDWESLSKMPFTVRQPPGNGNALGLVKFMFPNKFSVFLHDTNHRDLFTKQERTTSNGCIRLRDPFYLAEHLLARQGWDRARIDKVLATGKTTQTNLETPLPILVQYSTAVAAENEVSFREDIYKRDAQLLAALDGPFQPALSELPKEAQARKRAQLVSASASAANLLGPEPEIIGMPIFNEPKSEQGKAPNYFDLP